MTNMLTASQLRHWAENCQRLSESRLAPPQERARFAAMARALRELADQQDWLDGTVPVKAA